MKSEKPRVMLAWIGSADLQAAGVEESPKKPRGPGPIAAALDTLAFDDVVLLATWPAKKVDAYLTWLQKRTNTPVRVRAVSLPSPTDYVAIYRAAREAAEHTLSAHAGAAQLHFHLSPGTPAMTVVWIILGKSLFAARFLQSSPEEGAHEVEVPFDLVGDFLPDVLRARDEALADSVRAPVDARFKDIIHRSPVMAHAVERARIAAAHSLPVLLQGETGTGKELFAQAIHRASPRAARAFVVINCGAVAEGLLESELFGHRKGAFTGADREHVGVFEQADGGTLFLDEVGEVSGAMQVRLLRVLQEGKLRRVGDTLERPVDVRLIAATHRDLLADVASGRFREDLFYRLAVLALRIPALRERGDDVLMLAETFLGRMQARLPDGTARKKFAPDAKELLLRHRWPGNVRELQTTLQRAVVWSSGAVLHARDIEDSLLGAPRPAENNGVLGRALGDGFDLRAVLDSVARHYLERAVKQAAGNKTQAAALLGLPSYQTLSNWLAKYRVKG